MTNLRAGQFVRSFENDLGIGKVASVDDGFVTIEYFDGPTEEQGPTRTLPQEVVEPEELHQETRVYFRHPATGVWFIGRALIKVDDSYRVQFPNRKVGELPESALYVRWQRPLRDPTDHLVHRVNETPYFQEGRAPFRSSLVAQRAACAGMTGLFSSVVELEEHQIEVVRRVVEDPLRRYILADGPGLGKTIEAGAIMRQYAIESSADFGILVAVPPVLCAQWEDELSRRFLFDQEIGIRLFVVPHDGADEIDEARQKVDMVVIDDAHRVAEWARSSDPDEQDLYRRYCELTASSEQLLLLSSIPVRHNEQTYLAMLRLLDPEQYGSDDEQAVLDELAERRRLVEEGLVDDLDPVHPRVLRTRRSEEIDWLLPGREAPEIVDIEIDGHDEIEELVERWRAEAAEVADGDADAYVAVFRSLVEAACGMPSSLLTVVEGRRDELADSAELPSFDAEKEILDELADLARRAASGRARCEALVNRIDELEEGEKAIVFASRTAAAEDVWQFLTDNLEVGVVRHDVARHAQASEWRQFLDDSHSRVLVCDRRAEEGFNFQQSRARLIHVEVPTSPNRMERRLARLDRYGTGRSVESTILRPNSGQWCRRLIEIHDRGFGVFRRSLADAARPVEDMTDELWTCALFEGPEAVDALVDDFGGEEGRVQEELSLIETDLEIESIDPILDDEFYDPLWDVDFDADGLEEAAHEWIGNRLQFHRVGGDHPRIFRYEYRTESTAKHPTLLSIGELLGRFASAVDPGVNGFFSYPLSFHRGTACSRQVRVARLGEPFISAMADYVDCDDRGTSFAMWRHVPREDLADDPGLYFRFDFVVEADIGAAADLLAEREGLTEEAAGLRADRYLPPQVMTVWVRGDTGPVGDDSLRELLEWPYDSEGANRYGRDYNLNPTRWEVIEEFCDRARWEETCRRARSEAPKILVEAREFRDLCEEAARRVRRDMEREARDTPFGDTLWTALLEGVENPSLGLDSIGAVFLSTVSPFEE